MVSSLSLQSGGGVGETSGRSCRKGRGDRGGRKGRGSRRGRKHFREQLVGAGVPREGTHFRDSHIIVHRFNLVLPVGGAEDPITSVTT